MRLLFIICLCVALFGCTRARELFTTANTAVDRNKATLAEESRALTDGALRAVTRAPTNPPTNLARTLLQRDQQIEGVPLKPYDVDAILAGTKAAVGDLSKRMDSLDALLVERQDLARKLDEAEKRLAAMGALYEGEKNKSIVKRIWGWTIGTLGVGGTIALLFFFPFLIPIFTRIVAMVVGWFPKIAGFVGVVGTKTFDGVVKGIQNARVKIDKEKPSPEKAKEIVDTELAVATDSSHKAMIQERKLVLAKDGDIPPVAIKV